MSTLADTPAPSPTTEAQDDALRRLRTAREELRDSAALIARARRELVQADREARRVGLPPSVRSAG